ncbi:uncharacterized protein EI90DRAFT_3058508 [Cantharellus anzutake]|uniref:uncharacterized protein n=1 Tax=Cantharellus anzutake TaxID=1750568 RepID=UPI0019051BAF|nr:uncharacterized protein EI90DRAFT_3058508 [Cantharellus anzutake]KAF8331084.1 hypothetical protein EI90DRAFT_3058508 [Cantharellus anzutake]
MSSMPFIGARGIWHRACPLMLLCGVQSVSPTAPASLRLWCGCEKAHHFCFGQNAGVLTICSWDMLPFHRCA